MAPGKPTPQDGPTLFDAAEPADTLFPAHFGGAAGAPGEGIDYPNSIALFSLCGARQT